MNCTLNEIQGMIANCAIENKEHEPAWHNCQRLIDKFGMLAIADPELVFKVVYDDKITDKVMEAMEGRCGR